MKIGIFAAMCTCLILVGSCKKTPVNPPPLPEPELEGSYVGWGRPGGTGQNVWLELVYSNGDWNGRIQYGGQISGIEVTDVSSGEDSVRFEYERGNMYRCLGIVSSFALTIYILEPAGQPTYTLNREENGYNLSGFWDGLIYSQLLEDWREAELFVDQQGSLYNGDLEAQMTLYTILGDINDGAQEGDAFYFAGLTEFDNNDHPFRFDGEFVNSDSVAGVWQIALPNGQDVGEFRLWRRF